MERKHWELEYRKYRGLPSTMVRGGSSHARALTSIIKRAHSSGCVADLGCGLGSDAAYFAAAGYLVAAIELASTPLHMRGERERVYRVQASVSAPWPFRTHVFIAAHDGTTFINLTHEAEIQTYLQELKRTVVPGGFVQIVSPIIPDGYYETLRQKQGSRIIITEGGNEQLTYSLDELLSTFSSYFILSDITIRRTNNMMYGKKYDRVQARCLFVRGEKDAY